MAASGVVTASGDLVVHTLVSGSVNFSSFAKPISDRSSRNCQMARVSMRKGTAKAHECLFDSTRRSCITSLLSATWSSKRRPLSSSCYQDETMPDLSTDVSSCTNELTHLAISDERASGQQVLELVLAAVCQPHLAKQETGGEDSHFVCEDKQAIGVADGVGGWANLGIDVGEYARELMANSVRAIQDAPNGDIDPLRVLEKAHAETKTMGSSTACIITLKDQVLIAINLGDSGFVVVRDGKIVFESPAQQHSFNFPYQLQSDPASDLPNSGQAFSVGVAAGDVVVAGTDGLFDNLYKEEIAEFVEDAIKKGFTPKETAETIAVHTLLRAMNRRLKTPFAKAAEEAGYNHSGGKMDDITIIVSFVRLRP